MSRYLDFDWTVDSRAVDMFNQCRPSAMLGYLQEAATLAALDLGASGPQVLEKYNCLWMVSKSWLELDGGTSALLCAPGTGELRAPHPTVILTFSGTERPSDRR